MKITFNINGSPEVYFCSLISICGETNSKTLVDLGAGESPHTSKIDFISRLYVDIVDREIDLQKNKFHLCDVLSYLKSNTLQSFDLSIASDLIEHFVKKQGYELLDGMEKISKKQIIFTPLGEYCIEKEPTDNTINPDTHRSGWMPEEFEEMGWATIVFPNFHSTLGIGAFFAFHCENLEQEFERIKSELNQKSWAK